MSQPRKIAVVGGGAMGGTFAARLTAAGHDVTVLDVSEPLVEAINRDGIIVESSTGESRTRVRATSDPSDVGQTDLVLVFVKGHHTASAAALMTPLIGPATSVVSLQNGWGNADILAATVSPDQLVVGVTYHSATVLDVGRIKHSGQGPTFVGPYRVGDGVGRAATVSSALRDAAFDTTLTEDVKTEIWRKLVLNAATLPTSALTNLRAGELGAMGPVLKLVDALAAEAVAVAQAQGLAIDLAERLERIHATLEKAGPGKPSMLQDAEARRKTEIERINGAVVDAAAAAGIDVPLNHAMVALIRGLERSWALTE